jgi:hypothetical protein
MDNRKDDIGLGEQEEEIPQHQIDISTIYYQVSTEPVPGSSKLASTLPANEKKSQEKLLEHTEEVQEPSLEQIYIVRSLGNMLTWGEYKIPKIMDEVTDMQSISYV